MILFHVRGKAGQESMGNLVGMDDLEYPSIFSACIHIISYRLLLLSIERNPELYMVVFVYNLLSVLVIYYNHPHIHLFVIVVLLWELNVL